MVSPVLFPNLQNFSANAYQIKTTAASYSICSKLNLTSIIENSVASLQVIPTINFVVITDLCPCRLSRLHLAINCGVPEGSVLDVEVGTIIPNLYLRNLETEKADKIQF